MLGALWLSCWLAVTGVRRMRRCGDCGVTGDAAPEQVTLQRLVDAADGELWAFLDSEVRAANPVRLATCCMRFFRVGRQYEDAAAAVAADLYDKRLANDLDLIIPYRVELPEPATAARWGISRRGHPRDG